MIEDRIGGLLARIPEQEKKLTQNSALDAIDRAMLEAHVHDLEMEYQICTGHIYGTHYSFLQN